MAKASSIGGFFGGLLNNPGALISLIALGGLIIFRKDITNFFQKGFDSLKFPEFPDINFPDINFPDINFPEFPDFTGFFEDQNKFIQDILDKLIPGETFDPFNPPPEPTPVDDPILDSDLGPITPGENCILMPDGTVSCTSGPTFDVCIAFPELCGPPPGPDPGLADEPSDAELFAKDFPGDSAIPPSPIIPPVFDPLPPLPPGFEVGGPGTGFGPPPGTISETPITCNSTLGFIIDKLGVTASQASDIRAQACNDFGDFDFGDNTGSGFGPGEDQTGSVVTGGATLESEAKKASCVTCELFGLNCGICAGSI